MTETLNQRDFIAIPVSGTPVSLSDFLDPSSRWKHVHIGVSGGAVRWLAIANRAPGPNDGSYIGSGGALDWSNPEVDYSGLIYNAKFVKAGAADAQLEIALFW